MPKPRKRKLDIVSVQVMDNGYVVYAVYQDGTDTKEVFTSIENALVHVDMILQGTK